MTQRNSTTLAITEQQLLNDMTVSSWVKRQIQETRDQDVLAAKRDAELLLMVLEQRCLSNGIQ